MQNEYTPKGFKHGYSIVRLLLKRLCCQMENRWEKGQEQMSSEQKTFMSLGKVMATWIREALEEIRRAGPIQKIKEHNWMLWDVGGGNINSIFKALDGG